MTPSSTIAQWCQPVDVWRGWVERVGWTQQGCQAWTVQGLLWGGPVGFPPLADPPTQEYRAKRNYNHDNIFLQLQHDRRYQEEKNNHQIRAPDSNEEQDQRQRGEEVLPKPQFHMTPTPPSLKRPQLLSRIWLIKLFRNHCQFILKKIFAKPGKCNSNSFVFSYDDICGSCLHLEKLLKCW